MNNKFPCTIRFSLFLLAGLVQLSSISAQAFEWEYVVQDNDRNRPSFFWTDNDGNSYVNIQRHTEGEDHRGFRYSLLKINEGGKLVSTTIMNHCRSSGPLMPLENNFLLSIGHHCDSSGAQVNDTRLYTHEGQLVNKGIGFEESYFSRIKVPSGYIVFSNALDIYKFSYTILGRITNDFKITQDTIQLSPVARDGFGIVNAFKDAVETESGTVVLPYHYGIVDRASISVDHGFVVGIRDGEIKWQYPDTINTYKVRDVAVEKNNVGVIMGLTQDYKPQRMIILDQNGKVLKNWEFRLRYVEDFVMHNDRLYMMNIHKLVVYTMDGKLLHDIDLSSQDIAAYNLKHLSGNSFVIAGERNGTTVITKINFDQIPAAPSQDTVAMIEKQDQLTFEVDELSNEVISVSAFPNPASVFIQFVVDQQMTDSKNFLIRIADLQGRVLLSDVFSGQSYSVDLDSFSPGTYVYIIQEKGKETNMITGKFIKAE